MEILKDMFNPQTAQAAFEKIGNEQAKAFKAFTDAAKLETEEIVQFVSDLKDKKTIDEIANRYIDYWSGLSVRSMGYTEKAKTRFNEALKVFA